MGQKAFRKMRVLLLRLTFMPMILIALFVWRRWTDQSVWDFIIEWAGYTFLLLGIGIRIWSILYIGSRKSKELITEGPFSISRNPLYIGTFFVFTGISLCLENLILLAAGLLVLLPVHISTILSEEKHLAGIFGRQYLEYKKKVPRFFVSFRNFHAAPTVEVPIQAIYRATGEAMLALTVPVIGDLIELLHAKDILPIWWTY